MRFFQSTFSGNLDSTDLSILFMRFQIVTVMSGLVIEITTFNSLYEILAFNNVLTVMSYGAFNSLYEILKAGFSS